MIELAPAVFLDRDGVINEERGYVSRFQDFHFLPHALEGIRLLKRAGFRIVVITNQAGIGRGLYSEEDFQRLTAFMLEGMSAAGVDIDAVYHCPHHPEFGIGIYKTECNCRKPRAGMIEAACAAHDIDPHKSFLVGDKITDIGAGRAAHLRACVLVKSGHSVLASDIGLADATLNDLYEAAEWICIQVRVEP